VTEMQVVRHFDETAQLMQVHGPVRLCHDYIKNLYNQRVLKRKWGRGIN
jgi:hypothetical protein